jgi:hypothetical protein
MADVQTSEVAENYLSGYALLNSSGTAADNFNSK